jgi:pyrroline-5-carboxylate reductase
MDGRLAIIGAGNMAESIIAGVLGAGVVTPAALLVTNRSHGKLERLQARWGVRISYDNAAAAAWADTLLVAVKPVDMRDALTPLQGLVGGTLIISVAAGVGIAQVQGWLGDATQPVVRVMPNTPAQVSEAMSAWVANAYVGAAQRERVRTLLGALGREIAMQHEDALDQVTAVSGSGPAYLFYFAEVLIESARQIGLKEEEAHELVLQTIWGAAKMLRQGTAHPSALRRAVTSKGGTTEAALAEFADGDLSGVIARGVDAAYRRGGEIRRKLAAEDAAGAGTGPMAAGAGGALYEQPA